MRMLLWLTVIAAVLYTLHRICLWMESRGWIYYRKSGDYATRAGSAMLEVQSLLQPEKKHVIEMKRDQKAESDAQGEGKD